MIRWRRIIGLCAALFCLLTAAAGASQSLLAKAALVTCDKTAHEATFEGQVTQVRPGLRMQMRFTLQTATPDAPTFRRIAADGFGQWISAPSAVRRYSYDKTVTALLVPASYRVAIDFRWRAGAKTVRSERLLSPVCHQPDLRPDLVLRSVRGDRDGYVAVVLNRGKQAAGAFDVAFQRNGVSVGRSRVTGVAPGAVADVFLPGGRCGGGDTLTAVVDPGAEVDEADEDNDTLRVFC